MNMYYKSLVPENVRTYKYKKKNTEEKVKHFKNRLN